MIKKFEQYNEIDSENQRKILENTSVPQKGKIYRSIIDICSGSFTGSKFITDQEFVENDGYNLIFKIKKVYTTPEILSYYDKLGISRKVGDNVRTGYGAFHLYYKDIDKLKRKKEIDEIDPYMEENWDLD